MGIIFKGKEFRENKKDLKEIMGDEVPVTNKMVEEVCNGLEEVEGEEDNGVHEQFTRKLYKDSTSQ